MSNTDIAEIQKVDVDQIPEDRLIGAVEGSQDGPTVILLGGIHGNEGAGVEAVEELMDDVKPLEAQFSGLLLALKVNTEALDHNVRYVDEDLNRIWFPSIIEKVRSSDPENLPTSERVEMKQLLQILDAVLAQSDHSSILVDVHTFSAEGSMFSITNRRRRQTELLSPLHLPMVFDIDKTLRGTLLKYYQDEGFISFALEGGQHDDKLTKYNTRAALMLLLRSAGCLKDDRLPIFNDFSKHLREQHEHIPQKVELVYQHIIEEGDRFEMRPHYKNFQPVEKGEWLASDKDGKIRARCNGYMLMPLYQSQGNDGFFIIQEDS